MMLGEVWIMPGNSRIQGGNFKKFVEDRTKRGPEGCTLDGRESVYTCVKESFVGVGSRG